MNRLALFGQSLSILWRHKGLWIFGLLAALGGGGLSSLVSLTNYNTLRPFAEMPLGISPESFRAWLGMSFAQMLAIGLVLGIISFLIHTYAEGALIGMVDAIGEGRIPSMGEGALVGLRRFVPLLATKVLLALPMVILGALVTGSFLSVFLGSFVERNQAPQMLFDFGTMFGMILLINVLGWLSAGVSVSAKRAIVLEDISIAAAIVRGWRLMWAKFSDYFVITALLILLGFLFNTLIFAVVVLGPLSSGNVFGTITIVSILINFLVGSFTSMFISSVWTLAYRKWRQK